MVAPMPAPRAIATPCIQVCIVDGESGLCVGCHRTLAEVGNWTRFTDAQRARLMAELPERRSRIRPERLASLGL
jgi:predicted Fe-S protein YdhL (DUF1289 family)